MLYKVALTFVLLHLGSFRVRGAVIPKEQSKAVFNILKLGNIPKADLIIYCHNNVLCCYPL